MGIFLFIMCAIIGYAIGSVNSSVVVGKFYGTDVRTQGSKNAGLTNTLRVLGKKAAVMVLIGDILKGVIAILIGLLLKKWSGGGSIGELYGVMAGTFAVIGHNWPMYFGFKGGKGILTTATVIFMLDWRIGLIVLALFIIIVAVFRYVSLGSIIGSAAVPVLAIVFSHSVAFICFMIFLAALAVYRHKANIVRLLNGNENKLSFKKKEPKGSDNE
ncbi:MAG: glycerol-3-phosphate 1-O-acyltransferase PlsY [Clostridia bacterium]|nr:glycerol-3-phosphate 1-O-acyltransferase PlsY [Clostridia bacterium]